MSIPMAPAAGLAVDFADILEEFDGDGGGRQRHAEPHQDTQFPRPAQRPGAEQDDGCRDGDLQAGDDEGELDDGAEVRDIELHPDAEQEEQNAELGKEVDLFPVLDETHHRWAENDTGENVADNGRLAEPSQQQTTGECGGHDNRDVGQLVTVIHASTLPRNGRSIGAGQPHLNRSHKKDSCRESADGWMNCVVSRDQERRSRPYRLHAMEILRDTRSATGPVPVILLPQAES